MWRQARNDAGLPSAPILTAMQRRLAPDPDALFRPIQFRSRIGRNALTIQVRSLHAAGFAHIALNLRQSQRGIEDVLAAPLSEGFRHIDTARANEPSKNRGLLRSAHFAG